MSWAWEVHIFGIRRDRLSENSTDSILGWFNCIKSRPRDAKFHVEVRMATIQEDLFSSFSHGKLSLVSVVLQPLCDLILSRAGIHVTMLCKVVLGPLADAGRARTPLIRRSRLVKLAARSDEIDST